MRDGLRVVLWAVIGWVELSDLLRKHDQTPWMEGVRMRGILLLIDYLIRNHKPGGTSASCILGRRYISKVRKPSKGVIGDVLPLLVKIGIVERVSPGVNLPLRKASATYRINDRYFRGRCRSEGVLTPTLARKHREALIRLEAGLNKRHPIRAYVRDSILRLKIPEIHRSAVQELLTDPNRGRSMANVLKALSTENPRVTVTKSGEINTALSSCPRSAKSFFLMDGEPTIWCDISHAHWCLTPILLYNRAWDAFHRHGSGSYVDYLMQEHQRLVRFLSDGDIYGQFCRGDSKRDETKKLLLALLNMPTETAEPIGLYGAVKRQFPNLIAIIEDLKRNTHRNVAVVLHGIQANVMTTALERLRSLGIPAIPVVDAVLCKEEHRDAVVQELGDAIYDITGGVRCLVAGERCRPSARILTPF